MSVSASAARKRGRDDDGATRKRAADAATVVDDDAHDSSEDGLRADELLPARGGGAAALARQAEGVADDDSADSFTADFEFFDPRDEDFHGVKLFLNTFGDPAAHLLTSDLADAICSERCVGNLVKVGSELLGFLVALPFAALSDELAAGVRQLLLERAPAAHKAALSSALDSPRLGLLVSERMLNAPPQLVPPLHAMLHEELGAAAADRPQFAFDQLLLLATSFRKAGAADAADGADGADRPVRFHHFETQAYLDHASLRFTFPIKLLGQELRWTWQGNINPHTTVMLVPAPAVPHVLADVQALLATMSAAALDDD